ncbi:hypothetical protein HELRODRAFT_192371 [Helobdella robusta]|uniref:C2H2-type domain-containing protein n=1 Tax=Helobdella robusta TaxID=6412 RepID=T1FTV5_HELRO|nr:hypothetical protein HELRODRAFT_192371 [Helobdella robusta]ESO01088.1 hypothetical protein HELRODRAFT_192371 [Helobdella robusta]
MKPESDKLSVLLRDTVLLLCRNGFNYKLNIKVQGLIGITLDDQEIFLVHFNELVGKAPLISNDTEKDDNEDVVVEKVTYQARPTTDTNTHQPLNNFYYNNSSGRRRHPGRSRRQAKHNRSVQPKPIEEDSSDEYIKNNLSENPDYNCKQDSYCFVDDMDSNLTTNIPQNEHFIDRQSSITTAADATLPASSSSAVIMTKPENINDVYTDVTTQSMNILESSCIVGSSDFNLDNYNSESKSDLALGNDNSIINDGNNENDSNNNNNPLFHSSQLPIKEETDEIDFNFATLTETDCIDNLTNVQMYGSNSAGNNDDNNNNESSRGRRARRSGQKLYTCEHPNCGLSFYRSYTLYRHQRLKHGQRLVPPVSQQNRDVEFRCAIDNCGQTFFRVSTLEKHEREFHGIDSLQPLMSENIFTKQYHHSSQSNENNENLLFEGVDYSMLNRQNMT